MKGFSLIETLVVVGLFAVIGVVISQSTITSLKSSRKSDSTIVTRENIELAVATLDRKLRNVSKITTNPACDTLGGASVNMSAFTYIEEDGTVSGFTCNDIGAANGRLTFNDITAGEDQDLTSSEVTVTTCGFTCTPPDIGVPQSLDVTLVGVDSTALGVEGSEVRVSTKINLRAY